MDAATGQCLAASASNVGRQVATIPVTGSHSQPLLVIAGILLAVGAPLTLLHRRPGGRHFVR
jgi:LPXTG-motif cell wall-anchored protein